jgi:hypothetical protein
MVEPGLIQTVVDVVPGLRHQDAPDDAAAASRVSLTLLVSTVAKPGDDRGQFLHEEPWRFFAVLFPPGPLLPDREDSFRRESGPSRTL